MEHKTVFWLHVSSSVVQKENYSKKKKKNSDERVKIIIIILKEMENKMETQILIEQPRIE